MSNKTIGKDIANPIQREQFNANAKEFKDGIQEATHKTVSVATPGMKINFNKSPF